MATSKYTLTDQQVLDLASKVDEEEAITRVVWGLPQGHADALAQHVERLCNRPLADRRPVFKLSRLIRKTLAARTEREIARAQEIQRREVINELRRAHEEVVKAHPKKALILETQPVVHKAQGEKKHWAPKKKRRK